MRALVTGATGLIGANVVRELQHRGVEVRAMIRTGSTLAALAGTDAELVVGDVLQEPEALAPLMRGCELVFHAAAEFTYGGVSQQQLDNTAVNGTRNVLTAAVHAGVGRVVLTSSSAVFGSSPTPSEQDESAKPTEIDQDGFLEPPYVVSKVRQDLATAEYARQHDLHVVFACPTMSVGPYCGKLGPSNGLIVGYLSDPLRLTYPGGCNIVSVRDVAHGHWLIAKHGAAGEHYVLGAENLRWARIHSLIAELCGVDPPKVRINHTLAYGAAAYEELRARMANRAPLTTRVQARMIGRYYWYSHTKAAALGFAPRPARTALAEACAWLSGSPHISREIRSTMRLSRDVYSARHRMQKWVTGLTAP